MTFPCSYQSKFKDFPLHGRMYLTLSMIGFSSSLFGYEKKIIIHLRDITSLKKDRSSRFSINSIKVGCFFPHVLLSFCLFSCEKRKRVVWTFYFKRKSGSKKKLKIINTIYIFVYFLDFNSKWWQTFFWFFKISWSYIFFIIQSFKNECWSK